ncbi:unnamed protein product [Allacma fusca]|uniref:Uncharacterized protein n=1 Tax=Allacma fusca TaxID=39272 RepID=A0A8J2JY20_9HEXA|nr:unnamed protein product [Allacma fusca]
MLTKESLKYLGRVITYSKWFRSTLMEWDKKSQRVKLNSSIFGKTHFWFSVTLHISYEAFLLYRLAETIFNPLPGTKLSETINLCYNVCAYAVPVFLQWCFLSHRLELPAFINGYISLYEEFKGRFIVPVHQNGADGCESLLKRYCQIAFLVTVQNLIIFFRYPGRKFFLTSLFTDSSDVVPIHIKLALLPVQMQIWLSHWSIVLLFGFILYVYAFPAITMLREMRCSRLRSGKTWDVLQTPEIFPILFQRIQILQNMFNFIFQHSFFPIQKLLMSGVSVFGTYGAIKVQGPRAIMLGMIAAVTLTHMSFIFRKLSEFYDVSYVVLESWKCQGKSLGKVLNASRPIRAEIADITFPITNQAQPPKIQSTTFVMNGFEDGWGLGARRLVYTTAARGRLHWVHPTHSHFLYWMLNYWFVCVFEAYAVFRCLSTMDRFNVIPVTTLTNIMYTMTVYVVPILFHLSRIPTSARGQPQGTTTMNPAN